MHSHITPTTTTTTTTADYNKLKNKGLNDISFMQNCMKIGEVRQNKRAAQQRTKAALSSCKPDLFS
jgi:hypothetical protein